MTVQELYESIGGDYNGTLSRLLKEDRIRKYILKFPGSVEIGALESSLKNEQFEEAFRYSHSLKGVCLNLGLSRLAASGSALCEELRNGPPEVDVGPMMEQVRRDYDETIRAIAAFESECA